jgi:5-methyltetrahydropteroyltriglutamate--homocysteine methyltransferase
VATGKRGKPPFRADHVGSLLRPAELADAREKWRKGELDAQGLRAVEDKAVRSAVAMQEAIGLQSITDGEFRRDYWHLDFMWQFDGVQPSEEQFAAPFSGGEAFVAPFAQVIGKIKYPSAGIMREHFAFLKSATTRTPKMTIPAPTMFRHRSGRRAITEEAYPSLDHFWLDLGKAYNDAIRDLVAQGCRYVQMDDVNSALLCDTGMRERIRGQGEDPDKLLDRYVRVLNAAAAERPADVTVVTHMCRGNYRSQWMTSGGYDAIAEKLLNETKVDGFFMEYDSERSGDFRPLRFLPRDKIAVLGIVTSKAPQLEPKDEVKRRVDEATKYAALDQLCLSPQCGFSSTHHGNNLTIDEQKRKLAHIVELADEIWGTA